MQRAPTSNFLFDLFVKLDAFFLQFLVPCSSFGLQVSFSLYLLPNIVYRDFRDLRLHGSCLHFLVVNHSFLQVVSDRRNAPLLYTTTHALRKLEQLLLYVDQIWDKPRCQSPKSCRHFAYLHQPVTTHLSITCSVPELVVPTIVVPMLFLSEPTSLCRLTRPEGDSEDVP